MLDDEPFIVLAATPRGWAAALHAHAVDHGGVIVRATVLTEQDAREEHCDVLVLDDITSFLSPALVAAVHAQGRFVLGVFDPDDPHGKSRLVDAGSDALVAADAPVEDLVATIRGLAAGRRPTPSTPPPTPTPHTRSGRVLGVLGPSGGVGITEIAIEVAAVLGNAGSRTVLVDADEQSPALAPRLGLALHPNVIGGVDAVRRADDLTRGLHPLSRRYPLDALPGAVEDQDWAVVPHGGLVDLLGGLAGTHRHVVVDLGHCPPALHAPTGLRHGHGRQALARCDDVVLVTAPTPVAITRTIALFAALQSVLASTSPEVHVVVNRDPGDRWLRGEAMAELAEGLGVGMAAVLPEDPRVARAAWAGERVRRGPFAKGVAALAEARGWTA